MFSLSQKVVLVTGASRGLGAGIAHTLGRAGADVVVNYRSSGDRAGEVVDQLQAFGRHALAVQADVSQEDDVQRLFATTHREFGRLDVLVNNAGTTLPEDILETSLENWQQIINTNLTSTFLCSKYALEIMRSQGSGRIINISSIVGQRGALYGHAHYAATKSGQIGLTKTVARTAAPYGITVNAIAPGLISTELLFQTHGSEEIQKLSADIPLGLGTAEDVGYAVLFLASDEARFITGATIDVNGGAYFR